MNQVVTLQELELYDARPQKIGNETRFLCCLSASCREKPRDATHRSLCVSTRDGFYFCHRCSAKGKLREFWEERPKMNKQQLARVKLISRFSAPISTKEVKKITGDTGQTGHTAQIESLAEKLKNFQANFPNSEAEKYLESRGISAEIARLTGCGFASHWEHWEKSADTETRRRGDAKTEESGIENPNFEIENEQSKIQNPKSKIAQWQLKGSDKRVVFPIYNDKNELVAIHGRAIGENYFNSPKITKGDKSLGVFLTPNALNAKVVAICEGQIDALALWMCGIPAVAMIGTNAPDWLMRKFAFRRVLIATDADEAGDKAAFKLKTELESRAAKTFRLRPRIGKDWAEVLEKQGAEKLREYLAPFAPEAGDVLRLNTAWKWFLEGRIEAAKFLANLIEDGAERESLLYEMRRRESGNRKAA